MAIPIARMISRPTGSLYLPKGDKEILPMYAIADSFVKRGLFHQAFQEYSKIAERHPEETRPYVEMIRVAIDHLNDFELAKSIQNKGMSIFKGKDGEKILSTMLPEKESTIEEDHILEAFDEALRKVGEK